MTQPLFTIPLWADLIGVGLGGVQGALFASGFRGHRRLDLLGVALIGTMIGMGGGIIRDVLLGITPASLQNDWYLVTAVCASLLGMLLGEIFDRLNSAIIMLDAIVIGLFGAFGTAKALAAGLPLIPSVFVGACAAVGGGVVRDIAMGLPVSIMHVGSLYAIAAVVGNAALAVSFTLGMPILPAALLGIGLTSLIRILAVVFDLALPEQRRLHRRRVALETRELPVVNADDIRAGIDIGQTGAIVLPDDLTRPRDDDER